MLITIISLIEALVKCHMISVWYHMILIYSELIKHYEIFICFNKTRA